MAERKEKRKRENSLSCTCISSIGATIKKRGFKLVRRLGGGTSACCVLLLTPGNGMKGSREDCGPGIAAKVFRKEPRFRRQSKDETAVLRGLRGCKGVAQLIGTFFAGPTACMLMEACSHTLDQLLWATGGFGGYPEMLRIISLQLFEAIAGIHKAGYCHGDLKPSNVGWCADSASIKLLDMGLSFRLEDGPRHQICSPGYRAPEVLTWNKWCVGDGAGHKDLDKKLAIDGVKADAWALGIISVRLASTLSTPIPPFPSPTSDNKYVQASVNKWLFAALPPAYRNKSLIPPFVHVVQSLLNCDKRHRATPKTAHRALKAWDLTSAQAKAEVKDLMPWSIPTRVVGIFDMIVGGESEDERKEILEDAEEKCQSCGRVLNISIARAALPPVTMSAVANKKVLINKVPPADAKESPAAPKSPSSLTESVKKVAPCKLPQEVGENRRPTMIVVVFHRASAAQKALGMLLKASYDGRNITAAFLPPITSVDVAGTEPLLPKATATVSETPQEGAKSIM